MGGGGKMATYTNKYERDAMRGANKFASQTGREYEQALSGFRGYDPMQQFYNSAPQAQALAQQTIDPYQAAARNWAAREADLSREAALGAGGAGGYRYSSMADRNASRAAQDVLLGAETQLASQKSALDQALYGMNLQNIGIKNQNLGAIFGQSAADRMGAQQQRNQLGSSIGTSYYQPGAWDYAQQALGIGAGGASAFASLPPGTQQGMFGGLFGQNNNNPYSPGPKGYDEFGMYGGSGGGTITPSSGKP